MNRRIILAFKFNEARLTSHGFASGSLKKLFSIDCVNIYLSEYVFQQILPVGKMWGYTELLMSWFLTIKQN